MLRLPEKGAFDQKGGEPRPLASILQGGGEQHDVR